MVTVEEFLKEECIEVKKNEADDYVGLMMDNHKCIQYCNKQYYIPETNMFGEDEIMFNFLVDNYSF